MLSATHLWVNPDCGLKTRGDAEVWPSMKHMVAAARRMREAVGYEWSRFRCLCLWFVLVCIRCGGRGKRGLMRVEFQQTSGFVGGNWRITLDTSQMSPDEAAELARLVADVDFFTLPRGLVCKTTLIAVDHFSYEISISDGQRKRRIRTDDVGMSAKLRTLVNFLSVRAQLAT